MRMSHSLGSAEKIVKFDEKGVKVNFNDNSKIINVCEKTNIFFKSD